MQHCQAHTRYHDHGTFQNHKRHLIVGERAPEATLELGHSKDGAYQNGHGCGRQSYAQETKEQYVSYESFTNGNFRMDRVVGEGLEGEVGQNEGHCNAETDPSKIHSNDRLWRKLCPLVLRSSL